MKFITILNSLQLKYTRVGESLLFLHIMSPIPTIDQFVQELDKESRWYDLGVFLGIPTSELDIIGQNYRLEGIQRCLIELLKCLQSRSKPVSWNDIIEALIKMHNNHLANQICHKFLPSQYLPSPHSEGEALVSESNTQMRDTGDVNETKDESIYVDDKIIKAFNNLITSFASLVLHIKNSLQRRSVSIHDLQVFLQALCNLEPISPDVVTMEKIFSRLHRYYCFLNYHVLISIVDTFLCNDKPLKQLIKGYASKLRTFKKSAKMKDLVGVIKEKRALYDSHNVVEIKLHSFWDRINIHRFERMAMVVFQESYNLHVHIKVTDGCICVSWIIPNIYPYRLIPDSHGFMRRLGIISIKIGDNIIYECLDESCSVLESTFLQAFELEDIGAMELLLAVGCDTNTQTYTGEVVITSAMNMKDHKGFTLLHYASMNGHDDVVRLLLNADFDVNASLEDGSTPIYIASWFGYLDVICTLLEFGADPNRKKSAGWTPLMIAIQNGHSDVVELLLKTKVDVSSCNKNGSTAIDIASRNGNLTVVSTLLQFGADPNVKEINGWTPLMKATANGHDNVVEVLLKAKVDANAPLKNGSTALHIASQNGYADVVFTLLKFCANPSQKQSDGWTPLMKATENGHYKVVEVLLKAEVNVNTSLEDGSTALHIASQNGHLVVISMLLQFGADPDIKRNDGVTPLIIASYAGNNDIVELLLQTNKVDVNACNANGATALYIACHNGHLCVVSTLLRSGANPNLKDNNWWTPLMIASQKSHSDIVKLLLQANGDPNISSKDGLTALYLACQNGHSAIALLLLMSGAYSYLHKKHPVMEHSKDMKRFSTENLNVLFYEV